MTQADAVMAGIVTGMAGFIISPLGGILSDVIGRKPVILVSRVAVIAAVVPLFIWLKNSPTVFNLLVVEGVLASLAAFGGATAIGSMTELFPRNARATGMAIVYSLGVALSGGDGAIRRNIFRRNQLRHHAGSMVCRDHVADHQRNTHLVARN